jgi:tetratricopeptide (TPR) repeat protein
MKKLFFLMLFIPIIGNAQTSEVCECLEFREKVKDEIISVKYDIEKSTIIRLKHRDKLVKCRELIQSFTYETLKKCPSYQLDQIQIQLKFDSLLVNSLKRLNAIIENHESFDSYYFRGSTYLMMEDYLNALQDFNKSIELGNVSPEIYDKRAETKYALGDYRGTILDCNKAIELDKNYGHGFFFRARAKLMLKDYKGALLDYGRAIELGIVGGYFDRAFIKFKFNDKEGACLDFSKAGELGMFEAYEYIREHCN